MSRKKEPRYRNGEDAANRLHRSILRYKTVPVMLTHVEGMSFRVHFLDKEDEKLLADDVAKSKASGLPYLVVDGNDKDLDVESPPTGYVNIWDKKIATVAFLSRIPVRRYSQGLTVGNTSMINEHTRHELITGRGDWPCKHKALADMIRNDYPSISKCLEALQDEDTEGLAFTRSLAAVRLQTNPEVLGLHWKSNRVGFFKSDVDEPTVSILPDWSSYNILKSSLMNAGVHVL